MRKRDYNFVSQMRNFIITRTQTWSSWMQKKRTKIVVVTVENELLRSQWKYLKRQSEMKMKERKDRTSRNQSKLELRNVTDRRRAKKGEWTKTNGEKRYLRSIRQECLPSGVNYLATVKSQRKARHWRTRVEREDARGRRWRKRKRMATDTAHKAEKKRKRGKRERDGQTKRRGK